MLGLIGLAEFIPAVVLALPAGHAADSHDRRRVTALGLAVVTGAAVALAIDAGRGDTAVWPLYVLAFVIGIGNAYSGPAVGPLLAAGVSQAMLARAVAVLTSVMQAAMIAGPAVAGLLQVVGPPVPYAFAAVCAVLAMVMVMLVPQGDRPRARRPSRRPACPTRWPACASSSTRRRCWVRSRST